ncbi:hypothetical protein FQN57_005785 [Myotisia sp. PD_48]|nr:hypothetical protein FQN57_005785 [Myotisia sp. PD_48]
MALHPSHHGLKMFPKSDAPNTLEICEYSNIPFWFLSLDKLIAEKIDLDYTCPFSAKMFRTIHNDLYSLLDKKYPGNIQVIFRPLIQPWHPSSTLTHEAAVAVLLTEPAKFWRFSNALFQHQEEFFDSNVVDETRNQTYERLTQLAKKTCSIDPEKLYNMLQIQGPGDVQSLNAGNHLTPHLKFLTKASRIVGAHFTPTVYYNGVEERSIDSSFTKEQWEDWVAKQLST